MTSSPVQAAVIGAGAWGTALAQQLAVSGQTVKIWAYEPEVAAAINEQHENTVFLPGAVLHQDLSASNDLAQVLAGAQLVILVMPSHVYRAVLAGAAEHLPAEAVMVSGSKGIEADTGYTMCEVAQDVLAKTFHRRLAALSGPSFAKEVAAGAPTAVTVASREPAAAQLAQRAFAGPLFRVYTSPDLVGVELGGAV